MICNACGDRQWSHSANECSDKKIGILHQECSHCTHERFEFEMRSRYDSAVGWGKWKGIGSKTGTLDTSIMLAFTENPRLQMLTRTFHNMIFEYRRAK